MARKKAEKNKEALVKKESVDLSVFEEFEGAGLDEFGEEEFMSSPTIKISQPTSDYERKGVFFRNDSQEELGKEIWVTLLHIQRKMRYKTDLGEFPPCYSHDALTPAPHLEYPYGEKCNIKTRRGLSPCCEHAKFVTQKDGTKKAPSCDQQWTLALCLDNEPSPDNCFLFYCQRMNMSPMRNFIKQFKAKFRGKLPTFALHFMITLDKEKGEKGTYYILNFPDLQTEVDRFSITTDRDKLHDLFETHKFFKDYLSNVNIAEDTNTSTDFNTAEYTEEEESVPPPQDEDFQPQQQNLLETPATEEDDWGAEE